MKKGLFLFSMLVLLSACAHKNANSHKQMVGNDRDKHGCIGSAGYTWSEARKECIRLFEEGIRTESIDDESVSAYIVLSKDSLQTELFFSNGKKTLILTKKEGSIWSMSKDNTINVILEKSNWSITLNGELKYKQTK